MNKKLLIGFSPCPNDTFMFDALTNGKLDIPYQFEVHMADIEQLNQKALNGELDITKVSYHTAALLTDQYQILNSGSALGSNCGPLLLSKNPFLIEDIKTAKIAIPGEYTTANMLLKLAFPTIGSSKEYLFSDIEQAVLSEEVDLGLVIHENRFTYQDKGLNKLIDLGEYWEEKTKLPIPLGAIIIKRSLTNKIKNDIDHYLRKSIQFAFDHPQSASSFITSHAQAMDETVMYKHIDLYVNKYSLDLGVVGKKSVEKVFELLVQNGIIDSIPNQIFVD